MMVYRGSSNCLTQASGCSPCAWSGGGYTLTWCYSTGAWTLKDSTGATIGTTTAGCAFPLDISTSQGIASVFTTCDWTAWPETATVTISGIPDTFGSYTTCPSAVDFYQGASALNGTFICDLGAIQNIPCGWSYFETVDLSLCDRPGSPAIPCPGSQCSTDPCQYSIEVKLSCFPGAQWQLVTSIELLDQDTSPIFQCTSSNLIAASGGGCSFPWTPTYTNCLPAATRLGAPTAPAVSVTFP
ncbi:MAG TPA: hypothetical protein VFW87_09480 [Pirellulales bacterium]|nr:hypothetical protein [Pirellulales bacterium]